MLKDRLCQIGFTGNESKIYLELLKLGPQAVSVIAKKAHLNRTTAYSVLKALEQKGVVSSYINGNIRFFVASDPNTLISYLDRKCKTFDYYRSQLLTAIPEFRNVVEGYDFKKPIVIYFEGIEGVKQVMYDSLNVKGECLTYFALDKWLKLGLKNFLLEFKDFRILNKKVPLKAIAPDTKEIRAFFEENYDMKNGMTKVLYVSDSNYSQIFENEITVYDDKVSIIRLNKGDEYGVVIQSKEIADMHRLIFDMSWEGFEMRNRKKVKI